MKLKISHILTEHRFEAEDLQKRLKAGEEFADLARKRSRCPSATQGGDLGEVDSRRLDPAFAEAAEALAPGSVSGPVRTRFGFHLIWRR